MEHQRTSAFKGWAEEYQTMGKMEDSLKGMVSWKGKKTVSSKRDDLLVTIHGCKMKTGKCLLGLVSRKILIILAREILAG